MVLVVKMPQNDQKCVICVGCLDLIRVCDDCCRVNKVLSFDPYPDWDEDEWNIRSIMWFHHSSVHLPMSNRCLLLDISGPLMLVHDSSWHLSQSFLDVPSKTILNSPFKRAFPWLKWFHQQILICFGAATKGKDGSLTHKFVNVLFGNLEHHQSS
jgi:hypothetical protein